MVSFFPLIWGSSQVCWSWFQLITDILTVVGLSGGGLSVANAGDCKELADLVLAEDRSWAAISLTLIILGFVVQLVIAGMIGKTLKHVLRAVLQLEEVWNIQVAEEGAVRLLVADNISQSVFSGLQALLALYAVLYWIAIDGQAKLSGPLQDRCWAETTADFLRLYASLIVKVVGGLAGVAHGIQFVAQHAPHTTLYIFDYTAPDGVVQCVLEWFRYDLLLTLFFFCNMAMHVLAYALIGAIADGWTVFLIVFGKFGLELLLLFFVVHRSSGGSSGINRFWQSVWKAGVSSLLSVPWRERDSDGSHAWAWVAFTLSFSTSWGLALAEGILIVQEKLRRTLTYAYVIPGESNEGFWPGEDKGVAWILLAFIIAQPMFLFLALIVSAHRSNTDGGWEAKMKPISAA